MPREKQCSISRYFFDEANLMASQNITTMISLRTGQNVNASIPCHHSLSLIFDIPSLTIPPSTSPVTARPKPEPVMPRRNQKMAMAPGGEPVHISQLFIADTTFRRSFERTNSSFDV
jgi:hypothetical protein